ncbi:uncharacterized protein LOC110984666 isoform X2 [Acanthaster planci]|uniref:Uncharacterized protein LOC110984666 isoform X2 n=1 Tax=Acanthaster planci TaxID=133434 RepID=A0A8B7Z538_ACAPL|nr:uncharacterized protein LOC110984666 isoform X2 [Acanthaster planci]
MKCRTMEDETSNLSTFDIYSDLLLEQQETGSVQASVEQLEKNNAENEAKVKELMHQLQCLQTQNAAIVQENKILKTNISELFKTAKAELRRKDRQLEELANSGRPRHWQQRDYKVSINDRLRDLRKNTETYRRHASGVEQKASREESPHRQDGPSGKSGGTRKPSDPEKEEGITTSSRGKRYDLPRNETTTTGDSKENICRKMKDNYENCHEEQLAVQKDLAKDSDKFSTNSDSKSKDNGMCSKYNSSMYSEIVLNRQSLSNYRIPKIPSTSSSHDHPGLSIEESENGTSSELEGTLRRNTHSKRSNDRSSPSKYASNRERVHRKSSHSSKHEPLSEHSRAKAISSRCSRRKRRHSSEGQDSSHLDSGHQYQSCDKAPQKKHKAESTVESNDKHYRKCSDRRRLQIHDIGASPDKKASTGESKKKRHRSKTSSHQKSETASVEDKRDCTRKRHQSDRKNKSLKRAKETLYRIHSTPKKHNQNQTDDTRKHKDRKRHSSSKHKSKRVAGSRDNCSKHTSSKKEQEELEEGEVLESDIEDESGLKQGFTSEKRHEVCTLFPPTDLKLSSTAQINVSKKPCETDLPENIESSMPTVPDIDWKSKSKKKLMTGSDKNASHCAIIPGDGGKQADVLNYNKFGEIPENQDNASLLVQGSQAILKDANTSNKSPVKVEGLSSLRQPDPESCGYSSEHETVLICAPASQDDRESVADSESTSTSSVSFSATISLSASCQDKNLQRCHKEESSKLRLELEQTVTSEDDLAVQTSDNLIIDFSDSQLQEHAGDEKLEPSQSDSTVCDAIVQAESSSKFRDSSTGKALGGCLKSALSKTANTSDSFSERILEVFGSNSFLESDDVESSREGQTSFQITEGLMPRSFQGCFVGDLQQSLDAMENESNQGTFSKTVPNALGRHSILLTDSNERINFNSQPSSGLGSEQNILHQRDLAEVHIDVSPNHVNDEQVTCKQLMKAGNSSDSGSPKRGSTCSSYVENNSQDAGPSVPASAQLNIQFGVLPSSSPSSCAQCETEMVVQSHDTEEVPTDLVGSCNILQGKQIRKELPPTDDGNKVPTRVSQSKDDLGFEMDVGDQETECSRLSADASSTASNERLTERVSFHSSVIEPKLPDPNISKEPLSSDVTPKRSTKCSPSQHCLPESDSVAEISINLPNFDALSCSASPAHDSLLGDSGSSCYSNLDDEDNCDENADTQRDSEESGQDYQSDQDTCSETAYKDRHEAPSELPSLSDGEIISNSDSEEAVQLKASTWKSDCKDRQSKPARPRSSRNKSQSKERKRHRSREKQPSSHKDRHSSTKHSRDRHGEDHDRAEFFKKKMRILEDRLRAQDERKHSSYAGSKTRRDTCRSHDSHSVKRNRLEPKEKRRCDKKVQSTVHKAKCALVTDKRLRESRLVERDERSSIRHSSKTHNGSRYDTDQHERSARKSEREKVSVKENHRDKRRKDHKR